jgi:hypothetical protein
MLEENTIHFDDTQKTSIKSFKVKPISRRIVIQSFPKVIPRRKIVSQGMKTYVSSRNVEKNLVQFSPQHFQRKRNPNKNKCLKPMIKPFPRYLSREFGNTWFLKKNASFFGSSLRNPTHNQEMETYQPIVNIQIEFNVICFCSGHLLECLHPQVFEMHYRS